MRVKTSGVDIVVSVSCQLLDGGQLLKYFAGRSILLFGNCMGREEMLRHLLHPYSLGSVKDMYHCIFDHKKVQK